jgi:hypothetical protein
VHGEEHWTHFYTDYGVALQKQFFGYFLKGEKNGWGVVRTRPQATQRWIRKRSPLI